MRARQWFYLYDPDAWELAGKVENPQPYQPVPCACGKMITEHFAPVLMCADCWKKDQDSREVGIEPGQRAPF